MTNRVEPTAVEYFETTKAKDARHITRIARQASVVGVSELGAGVFIFGSSILLSRGMGAEGFGTFSLVYTTLMVLVVIAQLGLPHTVLRYVALYREQDRQSYLQGIVIFASAVGFALAIVLGGGLFLAASPVASSAFNKPQLAQPLRMVALVIPLATVLQIWLSAIQGDGQVERRAVIEKIVWRALQLVFFGIALLLGLGLIGVLGSLTAASLLAVGLAFVCVRRFFRMQRIQPAWAVREWTGFSRPMLVDSLLGFGLIGLDILILGRFHMTSEVGVYAAAVKLAQLVIIPLIAFNAVFAPMISRLHARGDMAQLETMFQVVTKWVFMLSFPLFLLCVLLNEQLLTIFGPQFKVGATALALLALGQLINASTGAAGFMLIMTGRPRLQMINTVLLAALSLALFLALIPRFGMLGAALASCAAIAAVNLLRLGQVYWLYGLHPYRSDFLKPLIAGLGAAGCVLLGQFLIRIDGPAAVLVIGTMLAVVYATLLVAFRLSSEDLSVLTALQRRIGRSLGI